MTIKVSGIEMGTAAATEVVHFTGGLQGVPVQGGWALLPLPGGPSDDAVVFSSAKAHLEFARKCGLRYIGTCMRYELGGNNPPMEVWESGRRDPANGLSAADSWGAIAYQAGKKGDSEYANCASYISACLKVAGLRLRDVSNRYNDQLNWALIAGKKPAQRFSNAAMLDLYADFHSLASELASTRDHLARIAAIHVSAPSRINSLPWLTDWLKKPVNKSHAAHPIVAILLSALGTENNKGWLETLGDLRNQMLHRIPMAANKQVSWLVLEEVQTPLGAVHKLRLAGGEDDGLVEQAIDPLVEMAYISGSIEQLARKVWKYSKYPADLPVFKDAGAFE